MSEKNNTSHNHTVPPQTWLAAWRVLPLVVVWAVLTVASKDEKLVGVMAALWVVLSVPSLVVE